MPRPKHIPGSVVTYSVKPRHGKQPLSQYLAARLGVVEAWAGDLLAAGAVKLDGEDANIETLINLSDGAHTIQVAFPDVWPRHMAPTPMPLAVIHEDGELIALDKPPGVVVHPARGHLDNRTLQNGVRHRYRHLLGRETTTIGPVHRLDKETSGVCLFSLTHSAYVDLTRQFATGKARKKYLAVVDGDPHWDNLLCESPIHADPERKGLGKVASPGESGKPATTRLEVLARGGGAALVAASPLTGRPHQIRIHLSSLGLPIAGDRDYNETPFKLGINRQALHAARLAVAHPANGDTILFTAAFPDDMRQLALDLGIDLDSIKNYLV